MERAISKLKHEIGILQDLNSYLHNVKEQMKSYKKAVAELERAVANADNENGALPVADVSGSLPSEEDIREPIQNALYATRNFLTDECTELADGILTYLNDYGFKVVRQ
jgi:hypothetical protein